MPAFALHSGCIGNGRSVPTLAEVQQGTAKVRLETAMQAVQASQHLGDMPEEMGRSEADVRTFIHDYTHFDHDKDYRCIAASLQPSMRTTGSTLFGWTRGEHSSLTAQGCLAACAPWAHATLKTARQHSETTDHPRGRCSGLGSAS